MYKFNLIAGILLCATSLFAQSQTNQYHYQIDLLNIQQNKVKVSFSPPGNKLKTGKFIMPRLVPGYYDAMNFGQYVSNFEAFDKNGKPVAVKRIDTNSWQVLDLQHTARISYQVVEGWNTMADKNGEAKSPGTMFIKDSLAIVNYNSLVGYFEEIKNAGYNIKVTKNKGFYASSALKYTPENDTTDVVSAVDYRHLVDAPVMYCLPDTTWLNVGNTKVLVSFYSRQHQTFSKVLAGKIQSILENQMAYLGGKLPVKDYAFLIYHETMPTPGLMGDGLEHSQSTVCLYSSKTLDRLPQALMGVASHEFFHVLTPLNIHSEEIQHFNFLNPVLSKHLWLYEGMTEYATMHMPIKQKMIGLKDFVQEIINKINGMKPFDNTLSMTENSAQAIKRQNQYMNFYQKGALVGLCLDIRLRELSKGKYGTQDLITALVKKYGLDRSFKDDELFDVITAMTFPEIRQFFRDYVEGGKPLPLKASLEKVGLYDETTKGVAVISTPTENQLALRKAWIGQ